MIIRRIKTENFMTHESRELVLPERGIVLVTGENGVGKSTFIEAVSHALWGKTLRGTTPWVRGVAGSVTVETDTLLVKRSVTAADKESLMWAHDGAQLSKSDTPSKTQKALDAHLPIHSVWRYGTVLSASDAAHFTLASDAERKTTLETMLSLQTTEPAVKALRTDLTAKRAEQSKIENRLAVLEATITGAAKRIADVDASTASPAFAGADPAMDAASVISAGKEAAQRVTDLQAEERTASTALQDARKAETTANLHLSAHQAMSSLQGAACVTCGRALDGEYAEHVAHTLAPKITELEGAAGVASATVQSAKSALEAVQKRMQEQIAIRDGLRMQLRTIQDCARFATEQAERRAAAVREKQESEQERAEKTSRKDSLAHEIKILELAETVLDTRGLRTYLLAGALDALTMVANAWMARIANPDFRVVLKPFSETGVKNAISIDVLGAGGGYGYKASSGGQRKRIDLAILLALGELSRRSHAQDVGTLWFDEAFDQLDAEGIAAIVAVLKELAEQRCVVVIAHREILIDALKGHAKRVHIA